MSPQKWTEKRSTTESREHDFLCFLSRLTPTNIPRFTQSLDESLEIYLTDKAYQTRTESAIRCKVMSHGKFI